MVFQKLVTRINLKNFGSRGKRMNIDREKFKYFCTSFFMVTTAVLVIATSSIRANAETAAELSKKLSNPIAAMISVPFQFNYDHGYGPADGETFTLNVQPVVPFVLNDEWNLISRTIIPIKSQSDIFGSSGTQTGIGDTIQSFWLSPITPTSSGLIWGIGPVIYLPTATDSLLGAGKWGGGPTAIALTQKGPWTVGAMANHIWSFDNGDTINTTFLQPFVSYALPDAWSLTLTSESTYNWNTEEWQVPINAAVSKLVQIGNQPISFQAGVGYYAKSTTAGADDWRARLAVTYLFPK